VLSIVCGHTIMRSRITPRFDIAHCIDERKIAATRIRSHSAEAGRPYDSSSLSAK
jgi:hypothetical protein